MRDKLSFYRVYFEHVPLELVHEDKVTMDKNGCLSKTFAGDDAIPMGEFLKCNKLFKYVVCIIAYDKEGFILNVFRGWGEAFQWDSKYDKLQ